MLRRRVENSGEEESSIPQRRGRECALWKKSRALRRRRVEHSAEEKSREIDRAEARRLDRGRLDQGGLLTASDTITEATTAHLLQISANYMR